MVEKIKLPSNEQSDGEFKKRQYFSRFATAHLSSLRLHEQYGILGQKAKEEKWRNPSEHCLVEAVIADVLAEKLNMSEVERNNLVTGAFLHDFYKREQMRILREGEGSTESLDTSEEESADILATSEYSQEAIAIANSAADTRKMYTSYTELAFTEKVMYYIDSITDNTDISTIDERIDASIARGRYTRLNEEARTYLGGKTQLETMREISTRIQSEIAARIGLEDASELPGLIKKAIEERIKKEILHSKEQ